ncbi:MAG: hypothetical protein M3P30_00295 [Chloroflexota bacterium]|nr:hypothetical protein [Chloroflexota bacterium]
MLRFSLPVILALTMVIAAAATPAFALLAASPQSSAAPPSLEQAPDVGDNDDSRVAVQLIVAGIAVGVVVVFGSAAYLLRKKLGLVAPPPDQGAAGRH